jgi:hypothetical protein
MAGSATSNGARKPAHPTPPQLLIYMAAFRDQESGSFWGNYNEPNHQGAYQIVDSSWREWAPRYGVDTSKYPTAGSAPKSVQDTVAKGQLSADYYGAGEKNWRLVARIWNGGTPNVVPNPALGPGGTNDTYATQVLAKAATVTPAAARDYMAGRPVSLKDATTPGNYKALGKYSAAVAAESAPCVHKVNIDLKVTSANICLDKPLAVLALGAGGTLMLAGITIIMVAAFKETSAGRAVAGAAAAIGPASAIAKAGSAAGGAIAAQRPAARAARKTAASQSAAAGEARRLAPVNAEQRRQASHANAEARRDATAAAAAARARTSSRRAGAAHSQRIRHREEAHGNRMLTQNRARITPARRSYPGLGHETPTRTARPRPAPLPDTPPF